MGCGKSKQEDVESPQNTTKNQTTKDSKKFV